jgi:hypothetical protein
MFRITLRRSFALCAIALLAWSDIARRIEFTNGVQIAGIQAINLGDNLTQLMVSSAHSTAPSSSAPTSMIVERIIAVCKEMNVECTRGT